MKKIACRSDKKFLVALCWVFNILLHHEQCNYPQWRLLQFPSRRFPFGNIGDVYLVVSQVSGPWWSSHVYLPEMDKFIWACHSWQTARIISCGKPDGLAWVTFCSPTRQFFFLCLYPWPPRFETEEDLGSRLNWCLEATITSHDLSSNNKMARIHLKSTLMQFHMAQVSTELSRPTLHLLAPFSRHPPCQQINGDMEQEVTYPTLRAHPRGSNFLHKACKVHKLHLPRESNTLTEHWPRIYVFYIKKNYCYNLYLRCTKWSTKFL